MTFDVTKKETLSKVVFLAYQVTKRKKLGQQFRDIFLRKLLIHRLLKLSQLLFRAFEFFEIHVSYSVVMIQLVQHHLVIRPHLYCFESL